MIGRNNVYRLSLDMSSDIELSQGFGIDPPLHFISDVLADEFSLC